VIKYKLNKKSKPKDKIKKTKTKESEQVEEMGEIEEKSTRKKEETEDTEETKKTKKTEEKKKKNSAPFRVDVMRTELIRRVKKIPQFALNHLIKKGFYKTKKIEIRG
jgi:hypothetical protein